MPPLCPGAMTPMGSAENVVASLLPYSTHSFSSVVDYPTGRVRPSSESRGPTSVLAGSVSRRAFSMDVASSPQRHSDYLRKPHAAASWWCFDFIWSSLIIARRDMSLEDRQALKDSHSTMSYVRSRRRRRHFACSMDAEPPESFSQS